MRLKQVLATVALAALPLTGVAAEAADKPTSTPLADKPRVIVITDIGTEPDDIESMVRFLTYANDFDIEALLASTSRHLNDRVYRFLIDERIDLYEKVLRNLRVHDPAYPDAAFLHTKVGTHHALEGMAGVGEGKDSDASRRIIAAVDGPDPRPVWVSIWGGAAPLAQALHSVRAARSPEEVRRFVAKLRVYSISDQDDSGPWARAQFPELFWIVSTHGPTQYGLSTWTGISADAEGADPAVVSQKWLAENIRSHGPLGAAYPAPMFIMEGDTPSFLGLIPNGLNNPERPDWGGWGGRYEKLAPFLGLWSDVQDSAIGIGGKPVSSNKATIWRWRHAFQNDFAARMDWSITPRFADANHAPLPVLNGVAGLAPVALKACPGETVALSAKGTRDPDGDALKIKWWRYAEPSGLWSPPLELSAGEGETVTATVKPVLQPEGIIRSASFEFHVILEVADQGLPSLTRYRRAVITVPTQGGNGCNPLGIMKANVEIKPGSTISTGPIDVRGFSAAVSSIGEILANPAARAILERHAPGLAAMAEGSPMPKSMTLEGMSHFLPMMTREMVAKIDADLRALPAE